MLAVAVVSAIGLQSAKGAEIVPGLPYGTTGQQLDLCLPEGTRRRTAVILIHGGSFAIGDRTQMADFCEEFADGGFTAVTVSYRLTTAGHAYPAAQEDIAAAVQWLRGESGRLGIDPGKIVLMGYSAGGTLAMSVGLAERSGIAGVVSISGIADFRALLSGRLWEKLRRDVRAYLQDAPPSVASPISDVTGDDPPVLLFHARDDRVVPVGQSAAMAGRLRAAGVPVVLRVFPNGGHAMLVPGRHLERMLRETLRFLTKIDGG